jgi:hypothetical protein
MALPPEYVPQHEPLAGRQIRAFLLALFKNIGAYLLNKITQDEFLDNFRRLRYLLERPTHYTLGNEEDYFNQVIIALLDPDKLYDLGYRSDRSPFLFWNFFLAQCGFTCSHNLSV